jgi:hypothetical protein
VQNSRISIVNPPPTTNSVLTYADRLPTTAEAEPEILFLFLTNSGSEGGGGGYLSFPMVVDPATSSQRVFLKRKKDIQ